MIHAVKATPDYFIDIVSGDKTFEVRKNDRGYKMYDYIALNEYCADKPAPEREKYSERSALFRISYILDNPEFCKEGYVILGLAPCFIRTVQPREDVTVLITQTKGERGW